MNVVASMKDNNENIFDEHEISLLIKAFPKDIAALDKRREPRTGMKQKQE